MKKWVASTEKQQWMERQPSCTRADAVMTITNEHLQSIRGFGGCFNELGAVALQQISKEQKDILMDEFFSEDGCAFNFCRIPVGASDYAVNWYSHNEHEDDFAMEHFSIARDKKLLLPYIQEGLSRNPEMQFFASPWSPPTWMKFPKVYNYGTLIWEKPYLQAYADYFVRFIRAYADEGVRIDQLHIQNEPCSTQKFPSCIWKGEQFREFIRDYLAPAFERAGISTEIWLGTINGPEVDERSPYTRYGNYAGLVLDDPVCREKVKGVAYQWAGKYAMQTTHEAFPELELIQSESECGDGTNTWEYAFYIFEMLHHYFACGASAYVYWNMALLPGGESSWGWRQNSMVTIEDGKVIYNPEFYVMKHASHFIRRGARRLRLSGHWNAFALAFENPDGSRVVLIQNPFCETRVVNIMNESFDLQPQSINTIIF